MVRACRPSRSMNSTAASRMRSRSSPARSDAPPTGPVSRAAAPAARPAGSVRRVPDATPQRSTRRWLDALTFALFSVALGTNVPTPLLLVYRRTLGLSAADLTAVFGCYAIGLIAALTVAGPLSDRFGRRVLVLPFAVLSGLVSLLFIPAAGHVPLLYTGRLLQGVVSGVVFSVCNAWLQELAGPGGTQSA